MKDKKEPKQILDEIFKEAASKGASDIHIDPTPLAVVVRIRKHGLMNKLCSLEMKIHQEIISCIKIMAHLRTDIHQSSQDGRFTYQSSEVEYDIRVSIMPTLHGENAVLRIFYKHQKPKTLEELGFDFEHIKIIEDITSRSSGLIIVSGPTGSGKTTTLHSLLTSVSNEVKNIVTLEDPVEYILPSARQIHINFDTGITFHGMLRGILRQDPDVVMIGEIRDTETAATVMSMASTGHLVFTTIHASNAMSVLSRLRDLGIQNSSIAATVSLIIHQKLVSKKCTECQEIVSKDCTNCQGSGISGQQLVSEILPVDKDLQASFLHHDHI